MQGWSEADSRSFLERAEVVTPSRQEVMDTLCALVPAERGETFAAVELCPGGGDLAARMFAAFPHMRYLGLDGSEVMLRACADRLRAHAEQVRLRPFRLEEPGWRRDLPGDLRCVVSALAIHHLDGAGKRALYHDLYRALAPGGALLVFDLVMPAARRAKRAAAAAWDAVVRTQSVALTGQETLFREFQAQRENIYRHPDPMDRPDGLYPQLQWLAEAGFDGVDAFWQRAGHALFGGYRPAGR